jgi:uncharacterized protein YbjT (DUF2867 family)
MILITGATGFVGRALLARLLEAGLTVRLLVDARAQASQSSNPDPLWDHERVQLVQGSIFNEEGLNQAFLGVRSVFHLTSAQWWGRKRDLEQIDLLGTQNVIAAARVARVGRLYMLSHFGASPASGFALLKAKGQVEEAVRNSGLAYTIFRCGAIFGPGDSFVNNIALLLRTNPIFFLQPGFGEGMLHPLYIDDLVEALYRSLESLDTIDQVLSIGGPEYMSYNEMVRTIMRVTNAPRLIINVPPYLMRASSRLTNRLFPGYPMTPQWLDILAGNRIAPMGKLYELFAMQPARFEDTILRYMPKQPYRARLLLALLRRRR